MKVIVPKALCIGDTVGVIAPASAPRDPKVIDTALEALSMLGFSLRLGKALRKRNGFLAGTDAERLADLHAMFRDRTVSAILCLRGGYGTPRLLDKIDYPLIRKNPKIFCGFSDITALHLALFAKTGLVTIHGPNLLGLLNKETVSPYALTSWFRAMMSPRSMGSITQGFPKKVYRAKTIRPGKASGRLVGGNLSLVASLVGTQYLPSLKGSILFLEDVNEVPYRVDRMLTQLLNAGILSKVHGVVVGTFSGGEGDLYAVCKERLMPLKVPVVYGLPFGHIDHGASIPHGLYAELDAARHSLTIIGQNLSSLF